MNLDDKIVEHIRVVGTQVTALEKLGLITIRDLLLHIPSRYEDVGSASSITEARSQAGIGDMITVYGEVTKLEKSLMWKTKRYAVVATIQDVTGSIQIKWFNQPYISNSLKYAKYLKVTGKLSGNGLKAYFANPAIDIMPGLPSKDASSNETSQYSSLGLYPIYRTSAGVTSRWFYYTVHKVLKQVNLDELQDSIPKNVLTKYNLPTLSTALVWAHMPKSAKDSQSARKRFAFEEVFYLQLLAAQARAKRTQDSSYKIMSKDGNINGSIDTFIESYPFRLTKSQNHAIDVIVKDLKDNKPMARLLEGDVGSGKTAVAAAVTFAVVSNRLQVAYMAPTEVLARQLFESFAQYFKNTNIQIGLLTGSVCKKYPSKSDPSQATKISKTQLLRWLLDGSVSIVIGTHALIQKSVEFKDLALVIIDEQHRFGTQQRATLVQNNKSEKVPHLLSMTATPIPRTLALTIYGDLDLTVIDEMPKGRKRVITKIVGANKLSDVYTHIRGLVKEGGQAYVICPRVAPGDLTGDVSIQKLMMARLKSVTNEAEALQKVLPNVEIDILHGKMKSNEKDDVMQQFANNEIQVLVATSVIEVGVNVPNATLILIEGAERFGLSQLHQLRGRVLRSNKQAYCYLATTNKTVPTTTKERLKAIMNAKNGFELAEIDLQLRGAGELRGDSQWGASDMAMEAIKNIKMVEAAREEAFRIIKEGIFEPKYKLVLAKLATQGQIHLE